MGFRRQDLQEAFFVPGSHAFRAYGHGTTDPLEAVLQPGCFEASRSPLRPGELILVSAACGPRAQHGRSRPGAADRGAPRAALVMVSQNARGVPVAVRLVQDLGGPDGAATAGMEHATPAEPPPATPVQRRRGRPPGSRNRKPG